MIGVLNTQTLNSKKWTTPSGLSGAILIKSLLTGGNILFEYHGKIISGGPVELVQQMQSDMYDPDQFQTLDKYMDYMVSAAWRFYGAGINITGETVEERCASFVKELMKNEIIQPAAE